MGMMTAEALSGVSGGERTALALEELLAAWNLPCAWGFLQAPVSWCIGFLLHP